MSKRQENKKNQVKKENQKRHYSLIPEGYEEEYNEAMKKEEQKKVEEQFNRTQEVLKNRIKDLNSGENEVKITSKNKRDDFFKKYKNSVDEKEVKRNAQINRRKKLDKLVSEYCVQKGADMSKPTRKQYVDGKIKMYFTNKDGEKDYIEISESELLNRNQENTK